MTSIEGSPQLPPWRAAGLRYYPLRLFFRSRFGGPVRKISLDAGLGCPNRDGSLGDRGCIFCDPVSFSPSRRKGPRSISDQLAEACQRLGDGPAGQRLVAYFQPGTNTYGPLEYLERVYGEAMKHPAVVGLIVGTRPDCLPMPTVDLLEKLAKRKWVCVELGLQSIHAASLSWMRRGHDFATFAEAVGRLAERGIAVGTHLILGLPGERLDEVRQTAKAIGRLPLHSVKLHNLHAVHHTDLAAEVAGGAVLLPTLEEYVALAIAVLEQLPPQVVIDRLSADAPREYLIGPAWCGNRSAARSAIEAEMRRRETWQGRLAEPG